MDIRKNKKTKKKRVWYRAPVFGKTYTAYQYLIPAFIFLGIFTYYCLIYNFNISFYKWNGVSSDKVFVGLENYKNLFKDPYFKLALKNTTIYFLITIPVQAVVGFTLAYIFTNRKLFGKGITRSMVFLPNVMSLVVISYVFKQMFDLNTGFINNMLTNMGLGNWTKDWLGNTQIALYSIIVINIYTYIGFSMTLYVTGLLAIPDEVKEAALIDGASRGRLIWHIILPLLASTHITVIILGIVGTLKTFDIVWLTTQGGPARKTEMLTTLLYRSYIIDYKAGYAAAIAVVVLIIALILSIINLYVQKRVTDY